MSHGTGRCNCLLSRHSVTSAEQNATATRYILIAIALLAVAAIVWIISDVLVIGFGAIVLATVLRVLVEPVARFTHWSERWALVAVVLMLLGLFTLLFWLFGRQAAHQFAEMREQLPGAVEKVRQWIAGSQMGRMALDLFKQSSEGANTMGNASMALGATVGGLGNVLVILFAGVYLAADPGMYRNGALRLLPPSRRAQVGHALDDAGRSLRKWLVAQIIVMIAVGAMTGIGVALLGVPLSLSLGLLAGLLEFVPVVGPIAAGIPAVLLGFTQGPQTAFYVIILCIAVQQIESNILTPLTQRWAVELPPVIALLSIVACGLLFGPMGVIFATPMAVVVMAMVQHLYVEDTLENGRADTKRMSRRNG
jgi:predicted PurR-regulated permease PerM